MPYPVTLLVLILMVLVSSCGVPDQQLVMSTPPGKKPKNIVLMIGDGMGLTQISAAMYSNNNRLALEEFPVVGFHKSHCSNDLITDSAAGATAFACGVKTYRGAIGVNHDTIPCRTILEEAEEEGLATGLIATSSIVHATPASFIAHVPLRTFYEDIALDFLDTEVDLLIGGGKRYFDRREEDSRDLARELRDRGYYITDYFNTDFRSLTFPTKRNMIYFTADDQPLFSAAGREYLPPLSQRSLYYLEKRSEKGFFLMIEGSQIDWAGHSNAGEMAIYEILDFNKTIAEVLEYARKRGDTLVIVTADHETGGMAVNPGSRMGRPKMAFTTNSHTATLIPVFAYGPSAELFSGIYDNTEIYRKMRKALGFKNQESACDCD